MNMLTITARQLLLYSHTLAFAFAIVRVLREDVALLTARRIDAVRLETTGRTIAGLLGLLWITGVAMILLGTGLHVAVLVSKPKLAAKLTVVCLLTANGLLLHRVAFPMLTTPQRRPRRAATICVLLGAISSVSWLYASFVGVARLIAPAMSYTGFLALYGVGLVGGIGTALAVARPRVERLLARLSGGDVVVGSAPAGRLSLPPF
ncbi:hypothetical protein OKW38_004987 [Paraburkholderia sp. MM5496-R1]|uniref:hypothetical protein n=1 Tax=unclassified Paraburkholderia TaxID=2615204 RepID=UPI003D22CE8B